MKLLVKKLSNDVMIRSTVAAWRINLLAQAYNDWSDGRHIPQLTLADSNREMVQLFHLFCMLHGLTE